MLANEDALLYVGAGRPSVPIVDAAFAPWDTLRVQSADTVPVLVLEARHPTSVLWAIYLHGAGSQIGSASTAYRVRLLRDAGLNVLAVEYRGYGFSREHTLTEDGLYADARAGWNYLRDVRGVPRDRIAIWGYSLGGSVATHLAVAVAPAALITEATGISVRSIGHQRYPWLTGSVFMRNRFDNLSRASKLHLPWLLYHGEADEIVPFSHAEQLVSKAPQARLVRLQANHLGVEGADSTKAFDALRAFVNGAFPVR